MTLPIRHKPDYITTPGEILEEHLAVAGMSKTELATRCGRPNKTISEIIHGKAEITPQTAIQLERVLGQPATFWLALESRYRLSLATTDERAARRDALPWAKAFPVKALVERGHIEAPEDDEDLVGKLFSFFGVGTVAGWEMQFGGEQVAYRRSPSLKAAHESVAAWIRAGELRAATIDCGVYDAKRFRTALASVRALAARPFADVHEQIVELCATAGVAVVFLPELPKTCLSGIARWLSKDKALIQLSMRHKTGDHAWFSFFHEAGHIVLHGKKTIFLDEKGMDIDELEDEADRFAQEQLLPSPSYAAFVARRDFSSSAVKRFAATQRIAPGVVVGRLQHEKHIHFAMLNDLKDRLTWGDG